MRAVYLGRDKVIAGVCGGLADAMGIEPMPVRAGFVLLGLAAGAGIIVYVIAMLVLSERPDRIDDLEPYPQNTHNDTQ